jgi:hypothetical protein
LLRWARAAALGAAFMCAVVTSAAGQDVDAGAVSVRVREVRPPEGSLRHGWLPAADWVVYACGGALALAAAGILVWRIARRR